MRIVPPPKDKLLSAHILRWVVNGLIPQFLAICQTDHRRLWRAAPPSLAMKLMAAGSGGTRASTRNTTPKAESLRKMPVRRSAVRRSDRRECKVSETVPVLPAASVSLATIVCEPCGNPVAANDQAPAAFAIVVPRTVEPSVNVTTALGSAVPVSAGPVDEAPSRMVTAGATVSTVTTKGADAGLTLPATESVAVKLCDPFGERAGRKAPSPARICRGHAQFSRAVIDLDRAVGCRGPGQD